MIERLSRHLNGVSFNRGLAIGALVGAAIAGSTLWSRLHEARRRDDNPKTAGTRQQGGDSSV